MAVPPALVNIPDEATQLLLAVFKGQSETVKLLLAEFLPSSDVDLVNLRNPTSVEDGPSPGSIHEGETLIMISCRRGDAATLAVLLTAGADASLTKADGGTALMIASFCGHRAVVELLLGAGVLVDQHMPADGHGQHGTALVFAAQEGHADVVKVLCNGGATVNELCIGTWAEYVQGTTALCLAVAEGHEEVAQVLLFNGANPALPGPAATSAMHMAATKGRKNMINLMATVLPRPRPWWLFLYGSGAESSLRLHATPPPYRTRWSVRCHPYLPMIYKEGVLRNIHSFLHKPCFANDLNALDEQGRSPLAIAIERGHLVAAALLLQRGAAAAPALLAQAGLDPGDGASTNADDNVGAAGSDLEEEEEEEGGLDASILLHPDGL